MPELIIEPADSTCKLEDIILYENPLVSGGMGEFDANARSFTVQLHKNEFTANPSSTERIFEFIL